MRHDLSCNIVIVVNQLLLAYRGLAPEFLIFVTPPTDITKATDFIHGLKEKQEVWYDMLTTQPNVEHYNHQW